MKELSTEKSTGRRSGALTSHVVFRRAAIAYYGSSFPLRVESYYRLTASNLFDGHICFAAAEE
jgi:hypothetical protein